ncbi:MAG: hypothetical protein IPQ07_38010 [Myxococcales bacterium]|nr:hypothetical protein [Myxococcales bacterium]
MGGGESTRKRQAKAPPRDAPRDPDERRPDASSIWRPEWVEQQLLEGHRPTAVVRMAMEQWGISESSAWLLMRETRERWARESAENRAVARAEVLAQIDHLLAAAHADGDLKTVQRTLALKSELHGLRIKAVVETTDDAPTISVPRYLTEPRVAAPAGTPTTPGAAPRVALGPPPEESDE